MKTIQTSYCVIGSGITGLFAALTLAKTQNVLLITKNTLPNSNSFYAQGGIAVALSPLDHPSKHIEDTLVAGHGLCNKDNVEILVNEGITRVKEIIELGVAFDRINGALNFTKEGAHQEYRILHVKDMTGKAIIETLLNTIKDHPNITIIEHAMLLDLDIHQAHCHGCYILKNDELIKIEANAVLLATGGAANVYYPNTNPAHTTGDGIALAHLHGARLKDMEFMQFHPTVYIPNHPSQAPFLISEAVRGEGALLVDQDGHRFMSHRHPLGDLAPRNVVAQAIYDEVTMHNKNIFLDMRSIPNCSKRFPTIDAYCKKQGLDPSRDLIPIFPAAHYFMGGIETTSWGETSIQRLYAAGECASLGLHGANRLASNSLLEGLVFSYRASQHMLETCTHHMPPPLTSKQQYIYTTSDPDKTKKTIQDIMWRNAGIIKTQHSLNNAHQELHTLLQHYTQLPISESTLNQSEMDHYINSQEVYFLLINAINIVEFSLKRDKSIGSFVKRNT